MKLSFKPILSRSAVLAGLSLMVACDPVPRRELSPEEKQADMMWLYSKFGENYAPMSYKEGLHNFDYEELKAQYLDAAANTENNDEFYALVHEFVAEFQDAHTSVTLTNSGKPGRETVAYLGFTGKRVGDELQGAERAPTVAAGADFPVAVGTRITKINGMTLKEYVDQEATKYTNLGQQESNYTLHMSGQMVTKLSTWGNLPAEDDVVLTIKDGNKEVDVTIPWVKKDLFTYMEDMRKAKSASVETPEIDEQGAEGNEEALVANSYLGAEGNAKLPFSLLGFNGQKLDIPALFGRKKANTFLDRVDNFRFAHPVASWTMSSEVNTELKQVNNSFMPALKELRSVPANAVEVPTADVLPAYFWQEDVNGTKVNMGYVFIYSFSIQGDAVSDLKETLRFFQEWGIKDVVIDTLNNGGGSLFLLMELAQALSNKPVAQTNLQIGTNEGWIDSLESWMYNAGSDPEKVLAKRLYTEVMAAEEMGLELTPKETAYDISALMPWSPNLKPNSDIKEDFNFVLMINEMCVSACDIFAATLKDNNMATLVGQTSMGGGGNVVSYWQAPNSNMDISQTESLIVRDNGTYIENVGVAPDVEMIVSESSTSLYGAVMTKAIEELKKNHQQPMSTFGSPIFDFGGFSIDDYLNTNPFGMDNYEPVKFDVEL